MVYLLYYVREDERWSSYWERWQLKRKRTDQEEDDNEEREEREAS